jgi:hypothetical protein
MRTVLEPIEPVAGSAVFDGACAFCGIGDVGRPSWIFYAGCRCQHRVRPVCAQTAMEEEDAT